MITNVLAGLAGSRYAEAVEATAIDLARRHRASLTAITAINLDSLSESGIAITRQQVEGSVARFQAACNEAGVPYRLRQEERDAPFDYLISRSRYADLTVLGLRGIFEYDIRSGEDRDANLTLARLIAGGVRPILAVPPEVRPVRRVFASYSGSVESAATLRRFMQLSPYDDVELRIATFDMTEIRSARLLRQARRYCRGYGVDAEVVHYRCTANEGLLSEAAAWNADLLVMGNSAKNLLLRRMFGETALRAMRESEIPLFLSQ